MMTAENFNELLKNPLHLKLSDFQLLTEVIEKHPYFQAPRSVRLKALKEQESYLYNQKLKETAAYTVDREVLFNFITSKVFRNKETIPEIEKKSDPINSSEIFTNKIPEPEVADNLENIKTSTETIVMTSEEADQIIDPLLFEEKDSQETVPEIDINTPLDFKKEETHSFSEWLKLATLQPIEREEVSLEKTSPEKKPHEIPPKKKMIESSLIDSFLKNNPKINPIKKDVPAVNFAKQNNIPAEDLMTETLAKVYLAQHNYKRAIQAYKILSLKNPEKSGLFADQIRAIEKLQNNK